MVRWNRWLGVASMIAALGCGSGSLDPQPLALDQVNCARCRMLISEHVHAAQALAPGEEPRFYDDRGCLAMDASSLAAGSRLFVQLDGGAGWIDVEEAYFGFSADAKTPMGYGVIAFRNDADARRADREGRALGWPDVIRELSK